jgi:hypothetical protein
VEHIISNFRERQARNQQKLRAITASVGFSLRLHFDLEDGSGMLLRNVWFSSNYKEIQARRSCSS